MTAMIKGRRYEPRNTIWYGINAKTRHIDITDNQDCLDCEITELYHTHDDIEPREEIQHWEGRGYYVVFQVASLFYETGETDNITL